MNEKHLLEAIIQRIETANVKELSAVWHFVREFIALAGNKEAERK